MIPQLVIFSKKPHFKGDYTKIGHMGMCNECEIQVRDGERPYFSMCGKANADFGYPCLADGLKNVKLSTVELLAIAKARPYARTLKVVRDKSATPNTALKGHIITFLQGGLTEQMVPSATYPRLDLDTPLVSVIFVGSTGDEKDLSTSKQGRDLIKNTVCKNLLQLRVEPVNNFVKALFIHNQQYRGDPTCQFVEVTEECPKTGQPTAQTTIQRTTAAQTAARTTNQTAQINPPPPLLPPPKETTTSTTTAMTTQMVCARCAGT